MKPADNSAGYTLDVVVPLWNEARIIPELHRRIAEACEALGVLWRVVYVDDGSTDETESLLEGLLARDAHVVVVRLSRNFGQPAAIQAGLAQCLADATVLMDGDLQDPPELIPTMVGKWREGAGVVIARRRSAAEKKWFRRILFRAFHKFFANLAEIDIPANCGTFCLMGRRSVEAILDLPEVHRFFPGMRAWVGFRQEFVDYDRPGRLTGEPKQTLGRLIRYAGDAVFGYSSKPVVWMSKLAAATALIGLGSWATAVGLWASGSAATGVIAGMIIGAVGLVFSLQLAVLAFVAELARRTYDQSKQRPTFVVQGVYESKIHSSRSVGTNRVA